MLPFCGYHIGDYFQHWLDMGKSVASPPRIFNVNWFRKDSAGKFAWPGFGQNMRVLEWIVNRCQDQAEGVDTPLGLAPRYTDLNWQGMDFSEQRFNGVMAIDGFTWNKELALHDELFDRIGDKLPATMLMQRQRIGQRLG
jgi:phosphoenolpyruvate carboxykinase (GTP)